MVKQAIDGVAELRRLVGQDLAPSEWQKLRFEDIVAFADATGDHQWIHVDRERARRESPFKAPVARGYYTLSRIAGLFFDTIDVRGVKGTINYGLNKVRFPAPLREGARYRLRVRCVSVTDIPGGVDCLYQATVDIEDQPKPACSAEVLFRYFV